MAKRNPTFESTAEAYLSLLKSRGIDWLFANAGTDFAPIIEALVRGRKAGIAMPEAVAIAHETAAVAMAHGYYLVTGKPQAVMVHVNVGTANALMGLINASRDQVPMLFTSGRTPLTEQGLLGSRDLPIHWGQEMFDQGGMLREFVKWDYELRTPVQLEAVVDRALSIAMSAPTGPVYLSLPREVSGGDMVRTIGRRRRDAEASKRPASRPEGHSCRCGHPARSRTANDHRRRRRSIGVRAPSAPSPNGRRSRSRSSGRAGMALATTDPMHAGFDVVPYCRDGRRDLGPRCNGAVAAGDATLPKGCRVIQIGPDPSFSRAPMRSVPGRYRHPVERGSSTGSLARSHWRGSCQAQESGAAARDAERKRQAEALRSRHRASPPMPLSAAVLTSRKATTQSCSTSSAATPPS